MRHFPCRVACAQPDVEVPVPRARGALQGLGQPQCSQGVVPLPPRTPDFSFLSRPPCQDLAGARDPHCKASLNWYSGRKQEAGTVVMSLGTPEALGRVTGKGPPGPEAPQPQNMKVYFLKFPDEMRTQEGQFW